MKGRELVIMSEESADFEMMPARAGIEIFSDEQKAMWEHFFNNEGEISPLDKENIDPMVLKKYLPSVWMADLITDDDGKLIDFRYRLIGTRLTPIYGERTGEQVMTDQSETSLRVVFPKAYNRIQKVLKYILELEEPVFVNTHYVEKGHEKLNVSGLTFPVRNNSDKVNMIFGYVDLKRTFFA